MGNLQITSSEPKHVHFSDLLVRPARLPHEGKMGYMKRVGCENHLNKRMFACLIFNSEDVQDFSPRSRRDELQLESRNWNVMYSRFCPMCLQLDPIWKVEWELKHFDACPDHQCWLIDRCDKCGEEILWTRQRLLFCQCNNELTNIAVTACSPYVAAISAELRRSLKGSFDVAYLPVIAHMNVDQIQRVIKLIAQNRHLKRGLRPTKTFVYSPNSLEQSKTMTEACAKILSAWPESFYMSLESIEFTYRNNAVNNRLSKCFGNFYTVLYRELEGTAYDFIRKAFQSYLVSHWRGAIAERNRRMETGMRIGNWISGNHACKALSISAKRLEKMISESEIDGYIFKSKKSGRSRTYVSRAELEQKRVQLASKIDLNEATKLLGLSKRRMSELRRFLFPLAEKIYDDKNSKWQIHRSQVERILIASSGLSCCKSMNRDQVTFGHVIRYWKLGSRNIALIIEAVATERIKPQALSSDKNGICSWVFSNEELGYLIGNLDGINKVSVTVQEFASRMKIKQEVAYFLVRHQFVDSYFDFSDHIKQRRINLEGVSRFLKTYVFLSAIAKQMNCSSRGLIVKLQKFGVCPVSGPTIDGGRQIIMRRTQDFEFAIQQIAIERRVDVPKFCVFTEK